MERSIQENICMIWDLFDTFMFSSTHLSKEFIIYKFSQGSNPKSTLVRTTQFYNIYKVTCETLETPIGYIFKVIGDANSSITPNAISARFDTTYDFIKNSGRIEMWSSSKGLKLINYYSMAEVVTDLGTIFGINVIR